MERCGVPNSRVRKLPTPLRTCQTNCPTSGANRSLICFIAWPLRDFIYLSNISLASIKNFLIGVSLSGYSPMKFLSLLWTQPQLNDDVSHHFILALVVRCQLRFCIVRSSRREYRVASLWVRCRGCLRHICRDAGLFGPAPVRVAGLFGIEIGFDELRNACQLC